MPGYLAQGDVDGQAAGTALPCLAVRPQGFSTPELGIFSQGSPTTNILLCETLAASVDAVQLGFFAWWRLWRRDGEFGLTARPDPLRTRALAR